MPDEKKDKFTNFEKYSIVNNNQVGHGSNGHSKEYYDNLNKGEVSMNNKSLDTWSNGKLMFYYILTVLFPFIVAIICIYNLLVGTNKDKAIKLLIIASAWTCLSFIIVNSAKV